MNTVDCPSCGHSFEPKLKRRTVLDLDHLGAVAETYLRYEHTGKPVEYVRLEFQTSDRSAFRWVAAAREAGLLLPRR